MEPVKIGLLGLGTVGGGTVTVLTRNAREIARRACFHPQQILDVQTRTSNTFFAVWPAWIAAFRAWFQNRNVLYGSVILRHILRHVFLLSGVPFTGAPNKKFKIYRNQ